MPAARLATVQPTGSALVGDSAVWGLRVEQMQRYSLDRQRRKTLVSAGVIVAAGEILRCLKPCIVRETYPCFVNDRMRLRH